MVLNRVTVTVGLELISFGEHMWGTKGMRRNKPHLKQTPRACTPHTCGHPARNSSDTNHDHLTMIRIGRQKQCCCLRLPQVLESKGAGFVSGGEMKRGSGLQGRREASGVRNKLTEGS